MEFKVLSVLKKYMTEEAFTAFEKGNDFEKALNVDIEKYVSANTPKIEDLELKAQTEVIKSLGIDSVENVEQLKNHIKIVSDTTTDKDAELIKITKDFKALKLNYDGEVENRTKLEGETKLANEMSKIATVFDGAEEQEFYHYKLSKLVTEDNTFEMVFDEYTKDNGITTTAKFVKDDFSSNKGSVDIGQIWKEKNAQKTRN